MDDLHHWLVKSRTRVTSPRRSTATRLPSQKIHPISSQRNSAIGRIGAPC
jgi:hypothetical protein